jgi:hypothetical protein
MTAVWGTTLGEEDYDGKSKRRKAVLWARGGERAQMLEARWEEAQCSGG